MCGGLIATVARGEPIELTGGVTAVALVASDARIADDHTASIDFNVVRETARGRWFAYVEGNSSLSDRRVSSVLPEVNADAGTALDPDRRGRVQLSELNYRWGTPAGGGLTLGYLDASGYLDRSRLTNDENVQFLGVSFVNNPTIEFPDYTLGIVFERPGRAGVPQINAVLASSNGLADNPNLSYSQLLAITASDKGTFAALGLGWPSEKGLVRVGAWRNTRPHTTLDGSAENRDNYGLYTVAGRQWGRHGVNLRLGFANDDVSEAARFTALAYRLRAGRHAVGFGFAETVLSEGVRSPSTDDSSQIELFGRINLRPDLHITLSLQRVEHSGFVADAADARNRARIAGLRLHYAFGAD